MKPIRVLSLWLISLTPVVCATPVAAIELSRAAIENHRCYNCHGQRHMAELLGSERRSMVEVEPDAAAPVDEPRPELYISPTALSDSIHRDLACTGCHQGAAELPHARQLPPPDCQHCHQQAESKYMQGIHASAAAEGRAQAPTCVTCHGGHNVRAVDDRQSKVHPLNVIHLCGDCHAQHQNSNSDGTDPKKHMQAYLESVHGKSVLRGGLIVSATCVACHGSHMVLPSKDPRSTVHKDHVPETCGECHVGVAETYMTSIHGRKLIEQCPNAPVCTDCHAAHAISRTSTPDFMLDIVNECGDCHDKPLKGSASGRSLYDTYRLSYHGQVTALGYTRAARCSDCHGAHDILPVSDPSSRLHADHRIETCRQCHEGADVDFAKFDPHADYRDPRRSPLLHAVWLYFVIVMSGAFGFFGMHSIFWFIRSAIDRVRHGPHPRFKANPHGVVRFTLVSRINHALAIVSFFGLTLTGMPLFFSDQPWARTLANVFGGPIGAGIFHRTFAIMLGCNFIIHFVGMHARWKASGESVWRWVTGPNSMLPRWRDVTECLGMFRWFLVGGRKPAFDRWTYWEKFDYWAEIFGTMIIGGSGLMLWFPTFFSKFLPGWAFNVATIIHGYEALLAVGFIFTIHFFNAHLRMEKFPVDDVMFTGQLPEEELRHERPAEYERLQREGKLDALRVEPAPKWQRWVAVATGILAMAIGTTMVLLIVLAGLKVL